MAGKTKQALQAELDLMKRQRRGESIVILGSTAIRTFGHVTIVFLLYLSVSRLAGQNTHADFALSVLLNEHAATAVGYLAGCGGCAYGLAQKKLRQKNIERTEGTIRELESRIDPRRSSSKLTQNGSTNPEDL